MKIISITEGNFDIKQQKFEGYRIETSDGDMFVGISSAGLCCEQFGYVSTLDNLSDFNDSEILSISHTNTALNTTVELIESFKGVSINSCMFVNIETTKGLFQITAYNEHNGYYGHDVVIVHVDGSIDNSII